MQISTLQNRIANFVKPAPGTTKSKSTKNIASLDGLRAFAALGVVALHTTYLVGAVAVNIYHYPWLAAFWVFGNTGVQLFFALSGFLLFMPYAKSLLFQTPWPSVRGFYFRRALRILPGYYFSLLLLVAFVQPVYLHPDHWGQLFLFLTFFMDSSRATYEQIDVPYWTLAVEIQFYLLLPLVALGIRELAQRTARVPRRRLIMGIVGCLVVILYGLAIRYAGLRLTRQPQGGAISVVMALLYGVRGKFWEDFAVGMLVSLCFIYAQHPEYGRNLQWKLKQLSPLFGLAALTMVTLCALWNFRDSYHVSQLNFLLPLLPYDSWFLDFCISIAWGLLILTLLFGYALFKAPFEWKPIRWMGIISYSIYLWHFPILTIFKKYGFSHINITNVALSHLIYWSFFALVVIPWSALVYWFVERPFMRIKDRQRRDSMPTETKDESQSQLVSLANDIAPVQEKAVVGSPDA